MSENDNHGFSVIGELYDANTVSIDDPAELYHEISKIGKFGSHKDIFGVSILENSPHLQTRAINSARVILGAAQIPLPDPQTMTADFGALLANRKCRRFFKEKEIAIQDLATILYSAYGVIEKSQKTGIMRRTVPSGGGLYPLDIYVVALDVQGLDVGIYYYNPIEHTLTLWRDGDQRRNLESALLHDETSGNISATICLTGVFWRSRFKYGLRSYRFTLLEAGHMMQNILLSSQALKLSAVPVGGFLDRSVDQMLDLDGVTESALYLACIGHSTEPH